METRCNVIVQGLRDKYTDAIIDVKLGNADVDTSSFDPMAALLACWEKINKDKHGKECHDQQKYFSPFIISVDDMLGREALVVLTNLIRLMAMGPAIGPQVVTIYRI